jgi:spore maturation protein SpmB
MMLPISLVVMLLEESGLLSWLARLAAPLMGFLGLPGEAALVCLSAIFLGNYSAIAVIETLHLSSRDIIILATFSLICHSFFIENAILKRAGSSLFRMSFHRLFFAIATAWVLNLILPAAPLTQTEVIPLPVIALDVRELPSVLLSWFISIVALIFRISLIIFAVILLQKIMDEFGLIKSLGRFCSPFMRILGLSANAGYVWIVANVVGLLYGSAALVEEARKGTLSRTEIDLFNCHIAINHSQIEDTFIFVALGVPFLWAALPRFFVAIMLVWLERGCRFLFRRIFPRQAEAL